MDEAPVEWSVGMDPDLAIDAWSTAALLAAVLEALLEEPEKLAVALRVLAGATT
ncbi:MAG TPA: hypothetical protein VEO96_05215 [Thermoplasmata archaeon]|nr:hypothetical protein [Thermoplasmata archaeon]